ncbi:MAG: protein kinase, partial [Deltaproteobacteria bacterium]|nr:protein kinase [Deltaproteobacteria bacterium]
DVSPENILVGTDGFARILDFGVDRAMGRYQATQVGQVKGTIAYMTPEQVMGSKELTPRSDVFAASAVMWECITNRTLFDGKNPGELALQVAQQQILPPTTYVRDLPSTVNQVVMRGLERDPEKRWETAEQMAEAIEGVTKVASDVRLGKWLRRAANKRLAARAEKVAVIEAEVRGDTGSAQSSEGESAYKASVTQVLRMKPVKGKKPGEATEKVTIAERHLGDATASGPGAPASHRGGPPPVSQRGAPPVSVPGVAAASDPGPAPVPSAPEQAPQAPPVSHPGLGGPTSQPGVPVPAASDPGLAAPISQPGLVPDSTGDVDVDLMDILDPATPSPTSTPGGAQPSDPGAAPLAEPSAPDQLVMLATGGSSASSDTIAPPKAPSRKGAYGVGAAVAALAAVVVAAVVSFGSSSDEQGQPAQPVGESAPGPPAAVATGEAPSSPPAETQAERSPAAEPAEPGSPEPEETTAPPPEPVAVVPPQVAPPSAPPDAVPPDAVPPDAVPPPVSKPAAPPPKPWKPPPKKPASGSEDDLFGRK